MTKKEYYNGKLKKNFFAAFVIVTVIILFLSLVVSGELFSPSTEYEKHEMEMIHINNSLEYYMDENYSKAFSEVSNALSINDNNYFSLTLMASVLLKMGNYSDTIKYSERAMEIEEHSSDPYLLKEISLIRMGFNKNGVSYISENGRDKKCTIGDIITVNLCKNDPDNSDFWRKWNRLNLWESPGSEKYVGTTNACDDVEVIILEEREYNGDIYYKIGEKERELSGWL